MPSFEKEKVRPNLTRLLLDLYLVLTESLSFLAKTIKVLRTELRIERQSGLGSRCYQISTGFFTVF